MRHQFIRRAAALVLALVLALPLTAPVYAADEPSLTITSSRTDPLKINETAELTLTAKWSKELEEGKTYTYKWEHTNNGAVTFGQGEAAPAESEGLEKKLTVTGRNSGAETITLTATTDGGEVITAKYELTVMSISLTIVGAALWTKDPSDADRSYSAVLSGIEVTNPEIEWTVERAITQAGVVEPTFSAVGSSEDSKSPYTGGAAVMVNEQTAGIFVLKAKYTYNGIPYWSEPFQLTISGIVLSGPLLNEEEKILNMVVNGSATLAVNAYGAADTGSTGDVDWTSSDASIVSVMPKAGNLNAWRVGEADITATKGDYSAYCKVVVDEDRSVIADNNGRGYPASVSEPLRFWVTTPGSPNLDTVGLYTELDRICQTKTAEHGEYADVATKTGYGLGYITNLKVSPSEGTLYYSYSTEADTGAGVAYTDQFAKTAGSGKLSFDRLYFVPKQGVSGTVDITFTGVAANNRNFAGTIRVQVGSGSGSGSEAYQISYRAQAGEAVQFSSGDFDTYCQNVNGRTYNYIIFNLPKSSEGTLYYNYVAGSGNPVTTTTRFTPSGRYTLDDVYFVPNAAFQGKSVTISFRGADTSGAAISGEVEVYVIQSNTVGDSANVYLAGERGRPVTFQNNLFNDACMGTLNDTLYFVTFTLPDPTEGALYINYRGEGDYDSRVTAGTRCYYSGVPGLSSVSFVPASTAAGRVAISYTGYGIGGTSFSGTIYISFEDVDRSTIYYSVTKGGTVTFSVADFNAAGQYTVGSNVSFVIFNVTSDSGKKLGTLYHKNSTGTSTSRQTVSFLNGFSSNSIYVYYASPTATAQRGLGRVYFEAEDLTGTVTISYTAYSGTPTGSSSNRKELFKGEVVIQISSRTPKDINLSCKTGGYARLSSSVVNNACSAVMSGSLSYIEITSVPDAKKGHLYYNYSGYGTGSVVEPGDRFYRVGLPGIDFLTFVPFARFAGEAEITYIGYSSDGKELVSGRILVNVSRTTVSQYFNDMGNSAWAIDSVDYLYRNGKIVKGVGSGRFNPTGIVTKGDFTLMLVRAYGLTAAGSVYYYDVPANSYYADAIRVATLLGIISGSNGYFYPKATLTRQDAIMMLYNTLKVSGKAATNGLAADLGAYRDEGMISPGAREAMGILVQMGVVNGDGGYLRPQRQFTRAEAAMLLHAIMTL